MGDRERVSEWAKAWSDRLLVLEMLHGGVPLAPAFVVAECERFVAEMTAKVEKGVSA